MNNLNETTRCYPRTLEEAFEDNVNAEKRRQEWQWMEQHIPRDENWTSMAMCFFAGFFLSMVIFIK